MVLDKLLNHTLFHFTSIFMYIQCARHSAEGGRRDTVVSKSRCGRCHQGTHSLFEEKRLIAQSNENKDSAGKGHSSGRSYNEGFMGSCKESALELRWAGHTEHTQGK